MNCAADIAMEREALLAADRRFIDQAGREGQERAYASHLAGHARLHRDGFPPYANRVAIQNYFAAQRGFFSGEPLGGDVASSCDLGYTYGRYELRVEKAGEISSRGYYTRVWQRDPKKQWMIAADIATIY
jgi:hypothetical protein